MLEHVDARPNGILFDAYGTLFDVHSVGALGEEMFPGRGAALAALWRDKQIDYTRLRTLCDRYADFLSVTEDALRYSCERLRLDLSEDQCRRLVEQYFHLAAFPDALPVLERLHDDGFALAILSNGTPEMLESAISFTGMSGLFSHVLSADRVRRFKTAPQVYQLGVEAFHCPAADLVFVSSNGWDACCATGFGYRTCWINRLSEPVEHLGMPPVGEARSLTGLLGFVA